MASSESPALVEGTQALYGALTDFVHALTQHPWFEAENNKLHGTIYFLWDFQHRTRKMLADWDGKKEETKVDIIGRCTLADILLNDTTGKRSMMTMEDPQNPPVFGEDVLAKSKAVMEELKCF